jgi:mRNA interferase MazF
MPSTTRYRRGDIVLVSFPFTDLSSSKRRPALVISPDPFNEQGQDMVLIAITSREPDDNAVTIDEHDCVDGELPKKSFVKRSKLFTVHSTLVGSAGSFRNLPRYPTRFLKVRTEDRLSTAIAQARSSSSKFAFRDTEG